MTRAPTMAGSDYLNLPPRTLFRALKDVSVWRRIPFWQAVRLVSSDAYVQARK